MTPEEKGHYEAPRQSLQTSSPVFDVQAILQGKYYSFPEDKGSKKSFVGRVWIVANVKNDTKYSFDHASVFLTPKGYNIQEVNRNGFPTNGVLLGTLDTLDTLDTGKETWDPGEVLKLTGELDNPENDYEQEFLDYVETLNLPTNTLVTLDNEVQYLWGYVSPVDCFRRDCPYKQLKSTDSMFCGQGESAR